MKKVYNVCLVEDFEELTLKVVTCKTIEEARATMKMLVLDNMYPTESDGEIEVERDEDSYYTIDNSCGFFARIDIDEEDVEDGKEVMLMGYNRNLEEFTAVALNLTEKKIPSDIRDEVKSTILEVGCITEDEIEDFEEDGFFDDGGGEDSFLEAADDAISLAEDGELGEFMDDTFVFFNEVLK